MVRNDWENSLNAPNSSKCLPNCLYMSQNVSRCPKMSKNVEKCPSRLWEKMVGNDWENSLNAPNSAKSLPNCPKMSQNVPKMSQNVPKCPLQTHRCPNGLVIWDLKGMSFSSLIFSIGRSRQWVAICYLTFPHVHLSVTSLCYIQLFSQAVNF